MKRLILFLSLLIVNQVYAFSSVMRYWIDKDIYNEYTLCDVVTFNSLSVSIPANIDDGYHLLSFQLSEDETTWSSTYSVYFVKSHAESDNILYSIDGDANKIQTNSISGNNIDVSSISVGYHSISFFTTNKMAIPISVYFYKSSSIGEIELSLFDSTKKLISLSKLSIPYNSCNPDISALYPGLHPITVLCNNSTNDIIYSNSYLINKIPNGGNGINRLAYILDSDNENIQQINFDKPYPDFLFSSLIDISCFDYTPKDTQLSIEEEKTYVSPITDLHLFALDAKGFVLDSITPFIDKFRETQLDVPLLVHNKQYDFSNDFVQPAWLSFMADSCNEVNFRVRRDCDVSLYSPHANLIATDSYSISNDNRNYTLDRKGKYFLKLNNISSSRQIFSAKLKYLNGYHPENDDSVITSFPDFEGTLITWTNNEDWIESDSIISYSSEFANISSNKPDKSTACFSSQSDLVVSFGNSFKIEFPKFTSKIIFVPSSKKLLNNSMLLPSSGSVEMDSISGALVWSGFDDRISFKTLSQNDSIESLPKFYFRKIYATLSDIDSDSRLTLNPSTDIFDGSFYTHLYIWYDNDKKDCFEISRVNKIISDNDSLVIVSNIGDRVYPKNKKYIITFENNDVGALIGIPINDTPLITIDRGAIYFNNLPNNVSIYDIKGIEYFSSFISDDKFSFPINRLGKGIYIIRIGNCSTKIII